jgi:hypothetical protein
LEPEPTFHDTPFLEQNTWVKLFMLCETNFVQEDLYTAFVCFLVVGQSIGFKEINNIIGQSISPQLYVGPPMHVFLSVVGQKTKSFVFLEFYLPPCGCPHVFVFVYWNSVLGVSWVAVHKSLSF